MRKSLLLLATGLLLFSAGTMADTSPTNGAEFKASLAKKAGALGPFTLTENFPKSYFLIPKNLPFMVGLTLMHPASKSLNLTEQQTSEIKAIRKKVVPEVVKRAKQIKQLEITLANVFINQGTPAEMEKLVDEIGQLRIALSKKHIRCIDKVRGILNEQQFKILLSYAATQP